MNPKIAKYKAEREKNAEKIAVLQARNRKLDEQITKLENTDIIGMVRESGIDLEALGRLLSISKAEPATPTLDAIFGNTKENTNEN